MHELLYTLLFMGAVALVSAALTLFVLKRLNRRRGTNGDEAMRQARALRQTVSDMNASSAEIRARARRIEEILELQKRQGPR